MRATHAINNIYKLISFFNYYNYIVEKCQYSRKKTTGYYTGNFDHAVCGGVQMSTPLYETSLLYVGGISLELQMVAQRI